MPTKNPRLSLTLEPELAAQLRRLSELTGNSQSKLITEILDGSKEVFARLIKVLEAAKEATAAAKGKAAADLEHAQQRVEAQLGIVMEEFDAFSGNLIAEAERVTRRARKQTKPVRVPAEEGRRSDGPTLPAPARAPAASKRVLTPPSNRGVRSTANPRQRSKKGAN